MKIITAIAALAISTLSYGNPSGPPTNVTANSKGAVSVQEMLINGPPQLKMHSLAMISGGNIKGDVDACYLPGLKACAEDSSAVLRSISAKLLGENFVQNQKTPNQNAVTILQKLAKDKSSDVRFNAIFYGLAQIKNITPELAEQLIDIAAQERTPALQDRIIIALANYTPQVTEILNQKLSSENAIAYYEIYEEFTGNQPPNTDEFLDMPSSRPHLMIIKPASKDAKSTRTALTAELEAAGLKNPEVQISGTGDVFALMLTTYITRDYQTAKKLLSNHGKFSITQDMWLTPELEIQIEAMRKAQ